MRNAALLLIALLIGQGLAPMTCLGWEGDPAARKACCQRAHHDHAQEQSAADDCCAKHERSSIGTVATTDAAAVAATVAALAASPAVHPIRVPTSLSLVRTRHLQLHEPPHLNSPPLRR